MLPRIFFARIRIHACSGVLMANGLHCVLPRVHNQHLIALFVGAGLRRILLVVSRCLAFSESGGSSRFLQSRTIPILQSDPHRRLVRTASRRFPVARTAMSRLCSDGRMDSSACSSRQRHLYNIQKQKCLFSTQHRPLIVGEVDGEEVDTEDDATYFAKGSTNRSSAASCKRAYMSGARSPCASLCFSNTACVRRSPTSLRAVSLRYCARRLVRLSQYLRWLASGNLGRHAPE